MLEGALQTIAKCRHSVLKELPVSNAEEQMPNILQDELKYATNKWKKVKHKAWMESLWNWFKSEEEEEEEGEKSMRRSSDPPHLQPIAFTRVGLTA